jgi:uracil-DNA glycosylase family protein
MARETTSVISAADFLPARRTLPALVAAAAHCEGCPLFARATQTVFGEGPDDARIIMVGEQPGDQEDLQGKPFVGPAGALLDRALADAKIDRTAVYVTNAVKHFKWTPRGKRRLHAKPTAREMNACRPWLEAELEVIEPDVLVCLGATAAQSLLGRQFRISREHGRWVESDWAPWTIATYHPSALLRAPDEAARRLMYGEFVADLRVVARRLNRAR